MKDIIDINWKSVIAQELKTKIEKIISKHEDCFYSPWAELRKEIFDAIDYLLLSDTPQLNVEVDTGICAASGICEKFEHGECNPITCDGFIPRPRKI